HQVPVDSLRDAGVERLTRLPPEFVLDHARIDCITKIMTQPVSHRRKKILVFTTRPRCALIEQAADESRNVDVATFASATDQIRLAIGTFSDNEIDRRAMVLHVQ